MQRKNFIQLILVLVVLLSAGVSCKERNDQVDSASASPSSLPTATLEIAGETFTVELAFTQASRRRGLMFREELSANSGMFFIFAEPRDRSFYMKNCLINLDILFVKSDGEIVDLTTMKVPTPGEPLKYYFCPEPIKYALELPAGTCQRLALTLGQRIEIPLAITNITPEPD